MEIQGLIPSLDFSLAHSNKNEQRRFLKRAQSWGFPGSAFSHGNAKPTTPWAGSGRSIPPGGGDAQG